MAKIQIPRKVKPTPGHFSQRPDPGIQEGDGIHNGKKIPTAEIVRDAKTDGGKSQRRSLADRKKATGQTK
jgi:hypothetical protein